MKRSIASEINLVDEGLKLREVKLVDEGLKGFYVVLKSQGPISKDHKGEGFSCFL